MENQTNETRVSSITADRLYNLGNYEHVKFSVTVEVSRSQQASTVFSNLERLLKALNPKSPVSDYALARADNDLLQTPEPDATPEEIAYIEKVKQDASARVAEYLGWKEARARALELFNSIGGDVVETDAKDRWEWRNE